MEKKRALLQNLLTSETHCEAQHTGWPCNTCFHALELPLRYDIHRYWLAVLAERGDHPKLPKKPRLIKELIEKLSA